MKNKSKLEIIGYALLVAGLILNLFHEGNETGIKGKLLESHFTVFCIGVIVLIVGAIYRKYTGTKKNK